MAGHRRQMIFIPELNADSFLFLFEKGDRANSWSIRDYLTPHSVLGPHYAAELDFTLDELLRFDAPTHATTDLDFWHRLTLKLNQAYLGDGERSTINAAIPEPVAMNRVGSDFDVPRAFPIVGPAEFYRHPKSRKPKDLTRLRGFAPLKR
jgi:hypothetical protein